MTKLYLILVDGVLAGRKLTSGGAEKLAQSLRLKGYKNVSIAYELPKLEKSLS